MDVSCEARYQTSKGVTAWLQLRRKVITTASSSFAFD